jgi:hypothetical protein
MKLVAFLNRYFGGLRSGGNAYAVGDAAKPGQKWHVYYATECPDEDKPVVTPEMCMTVGWTGRRLPSSSKPLLTAAATYRVPRR